LKGMERALESRELRERLDHLKEFL